MGTNPLDILAIFGPSYDCSGECEGMQWCNQVDDFGDPLCLPDGVIEARGHMSSDSNIPIRVERKRRIPD